MYYATKIKMKPGCGTSNNLLEIESIYLTGFSEETFYTKKAIHDFLVENPSTDIKVKIAPYYPKLIPATSIRGEKYVKSTPNSTQNDNLLALPRE